MAESERGWRLQAPLWHVAREKGWRVLVTPDGDKVAWVKPDGSVVQVSIHQYAPAALALVGAALRAEADGD